MTAAGVVAADFPEGMRACDSHEVSQLNELKIDINALTFTANYRLAGDIIMSEQMPMAFEGGFDPRSDVFNRLLKNRVVMLGSDVNDDIANQICAQLLYLEGEDPNQDIWLYINSPGGSVTAGMAIYDTMQFIKPDVSTMCIGQAASMGALLLCGGTKGKRVCLPHSRIMIHQPLGGYQGQAEGMIDRLLAELA